jgi:hypothetical protein
LRNIQLTTKQALTLEINLAEALWTNFDLNLKLGPNDFAIYPIDTSGSLIVSDSGANKLTWSMIAPYVTGTSKAATTSGGGYLYACSGFSGCDGFSISVQTLLNLMPANGYQFRLPYHIMTPTNSLSNSRRRLLSLSGTAINNPDGSVTFSLLVVNATATASSDILDVDLGAPSAEGSLLLLSFFTAFISFLVALSTYGGLRCHHRNDTKVLEDVNSSPEGVDAGVAQNGVRDSR